MRIAQIAPLMESVPPRLYGGTERIVAWLCDELVELGHDVTLFATADSVTSATLEPCTQTGIRFNPFVRDVVPYYMLMLDRVRQRADDFDILHFHVDAYHFPLFRQDAPRTLTTLHGRQDLPDLAPLYRGFPEMPLVSISAGQRLANPNANYVATIHHGLPPDLHVANLHPKGNYLAFLGRISPEKGPEQAIAIARAAGLPLKIAAKIDRGDEAYFREVIAPLLGAGGDVEFDGEIDESRKTDFLGDALALLFPINWPEPFGVVMIEAMACGTPVLAFEGGAVGEVLCPQTGRIVTSLEDAFAALPEVLALDRRKVRAVFEQRFTARRMATDYVALYRRMLAGQTRARVATPVARRDPVDNDFRKFAGMPPANARHC
jgi:glycosyltransferase involved in cell wall biosynthesis